LLVSLALEDLTLPGEALVDNLADIFWLADLSEDARGGFRGCVACQPLNVLDLCLRGEYMAELIARKAKDPVMSEPNLRTQEPLKTWCLRRAGLPCTQISVFSANGRIHLARILHHRYRIW
jgi:hypothetical protein